MKDNIWGCVEILTSGPTKLFAAERAKTQRLGKALCSMFITYNSQLALAKIPLLIPSPC